VDDSLLDDLWKKSELTFPDEPEETGSGSGSVPAPSASVSGSAVICGREIMHRKGRPLNLGWIMATMERIVGSEQRAGLEVFLEYLVLQMYGKRNLKKDAVEISQLSLVELEIYRRIRRELEHPVRRERILTFIQQKDITKRLINYFAVHYALVEKELSYYLDRRTYPYQILGVFNEPHQPEILRLKESGANVVWLNFHQEYKNSKNKQGRRNRHAPYRRSVTVRGEDGQDYSLCEFNFYLWLDDVGGFELFYLFEKDIREKKLKYDEQKRHTDAAARVAVLAALAEATDSTKPTTKVRRKRKIVLRQTDGRNYRTHVLNYKMVAPYMVTVRGATEDYEAYCAELKKLKELEQEALFQQSQSGPRKKAKRTSKKKNTVIS
jgi:hypothetical protein